MFSWLKSIALRVVHCILHGSHCVVDAFVLLMLVFHVSIQYLSVLCCPAQMNHLKSGVLPAAWQQLVRDTQPYAVLVLAVYCGTIWGPDRLLMLCQYYSSGPYCHDFLCCLSYYYSWYDQRRRDVTLPRTHCEAYMHMPTWWPDMILAGERWGICCNTTVVGCRWSVAELAVRRVLRVCFMALYAACPTTAFVITNVIDSPASHTHCEPHNVAHMHMVFRHQSGRGALGGLLQHNRSRMQAECCSAGCPASVESVRRLVLGVVSWVCMGVPCFACAIHAVKTGSFREHMVCCGFAKLANQIHSKRSTIRVSRIRGTLLPFGEVLEVHDGFQGVVVAGALFPPYAECTYAYVYLIRSHTVFCATKAARCGGVYLCTHH